MGNRSKLEDYLQSAISKEKVNELTLDSGYEFELGLEIALLWIDELSVHLAKPTAPYGLIQSVKSVFKEELLLLLRFHQDIVEVLYNDFPIQSDDEIVRLCESDGFYGKLARIRFTHCMSHETVHAHWLPEEHPEVGKVLAVPLFADGEPSGCLAVASPDPKRIFSTAHAMALSLAASILSLALEVGDLRGRLSLCDDV